MSLTHCQERNCVKHITSGVLCAVVVRSLQSHSDKGTGAPFVLVHRHVIVEKGIAHCKCGTSKVSGREVVDNCGPFVEDHTGTEVFGIPALAIHGHVVVIVYDEGGQH